MTEVLMADGSKTTVRTSLDLAYVIQGDDLQKSVKVGRSSDPARRVSGLMSGLPFKARLVAVIDRGAFREREMKDLLADFRLQGEWYRPNEKLNEYLVGVRKINGVLEQRAFDDAYFEEYIRPGILEYLNGRQPNVTSAGDFTYRVLHEGFSAFGKHAERSRQLLTNCPHAFTPELISGYLPLGIDAPTPAVDVLCERTTAEGAAA